MHLTDDDEYTIPFGNNNYCGPCALAYILRTDPDTAAAKLREVSGKRAIRRIHHKYMLEVLHRQDIQYLPLMPYLAKGAGRRSCRLGTWVKDQPRDAEFLIVTSNHFVVIHRGMVYDSFKHLGVPVERSEWARTFVRGAWWIARD